MKLIKKINRAKWEQNDIKNGGVVSADAITNCLKTTRNSLSTWEVTDESLEKGVLAMVVNHDRLDTIDVVLISSEELKDQSIDIEQTRGDTSFTEYIDRHYDLINLNYLSLGKVAEVIVNAFKVNKVKRYTQMDLRKLIQKALDDDILLLCVLKPNVQKCFMNKSYDPDLLKK